MGRFSSSDIRLSQSRSVASPRGILCCAHRAADGLINLRALEGLAKSLRG